jgi:hypothetical protein
MSETKDCILFNVSGSACEKHKNPSDRMGYVECHEWAERKIKQGHIQRQCKDCGRWYFKCDM